MTWELRTVFREPGTQAPLLMYGARESPEDRRYLQSYFSGDGRSEALRERPNADHYANTTGSATSPSTTDRC